MICRIPDDVKDYRIAPDDSREWPEARAKRTQSIAALVVVVSEKEVMSWHFELWEVSTSHHMLWF